MTDQQGRFLLAIAKRKVPKWVRIEEREDVAQEICLLVLKGADIQDPSIVREALPRTRTGEPKFTLSLQAHSHQYTPKTQFSRDIPVEDGEFSSTLGWALACVAEPAQALEVPDWALISRTSNGRISWECKGCGKRGSVADNKHHLKISLRSHSLRCAMKRRAA